MAAPILNLTLVGFHGLEANRGPIRYQSKTLGEFSPDEIRHYKQTEWEKVPKRGPMGFAVSTVLGLKGVPLPESVEGVTEDLKEKMRANDAVTHRQNFVVFTDDEAAKAKLRAYYTRRWEGASSFHCTAATLSMSLIPILNIAFGMVKILVGISEDGSALGVLPEDRWKFKATLIAVGIAEVCFLGFIVHGVASLYFAMTSQEVELA